MGIRRYKKEYTELFHKNQFSLNNFWGQTLAPGEEL
jgi:hypothetical protein